MSNKAVGRNAPCPCGSKKKHKQCCGARTAQGSGLGKMWILASAGVVVVAAVLLWPGARSPDSGGVGSGTRRGAAPAPWQYDAANNRHWNSEHNHWHDGPPPGGLGQPPNSGGSGTRLPSPSPSGPPPKPWEYDAANNRHWDPGHNHWHQGPPPNSGGAGSGTR